jgi:hypothetical protein
MALTLQQPAAGPCHAHVPAASTLYHHRMKPLITIILLLLAVVPLQAGWFFKDPPPPPPDLGPEYRAKITRLEEQISAQHATTTRWEVATGTLALGCVLLFVIGTALGAKTRQHYDATRRLGRTIPPTTAPAGANGAHHHHLGEADAPDRHPSLAA